MTEAPASSNLLTHIHCGCKEDNCKTKSCSCVKQGIPCSLSCGKCNGVVILMYHKWMRRNVLMKMNKDDCIWLTNMSWSVITYLQFFNVMTHYDSVNFLFHWGKGGYNLLWFWNLDKLRLNIPKYPQFALIIIPLVVVLIYACICISFLYWCLVVGLVHWLHNLVWNGWSHKK